MVKEDRFSILTTILLYIYYLCARLVANSPFLIFEIAIDVIEWGQVLAAKGSVTISIENIAAWTQIWHFEIASRLAFHFSNFLHDKKKILEQKHNVIRK